MNLQSHPPITDRQARILEIVRKQGFATIEALASGFDVSAQSIRRDIIRLDAEGLLQRFHGGVGLREAPARLDYTQKRLVATGAKQRIADKAASLIPEGSVVFLDVGTTVEAVAQRLRGKKPLRVFTTSLAAAGILAGEPGIELFVPGGFVRSVDGSLAGETTLATLARFRFDIAVIGFSGIDADGLFMDYDLEKVAVKEAAMNQASRSLIVGDSSKFHKSAVVRFGSRAGSLTLVTEARPPARVEEKLPARCLIADNS